MLRAYGDGNLFGEPYGEGPVRVVWLHGWGRRGQDFATVASALARDGVASVAFDLPGFGSSPAPSVAGGARSYADFLTPALRALGDEPLVLVGHSFGGRVATVLASREPDFVRALVLTGVPLLRGPFTAKPPLRFRFVRWLHRRGAVGDARMETARQRYGSTDYRGARGVMRDVLVATVNESYEEELASLSAPVTMLWGALDNDAPVATAIRAGELLREHPSLHVLENVGHFVPIDAPEELAQSVREALA